MIVWLLWRNDIVEAIFFNRDHAYASLLSLVESLKEKEGNDWHSFTNAHTYGTGVRYFNHKNARIEIEPREVRSTAQFWPA